MPAPIPDVSATRLALVALTTLVASVINAIAGGGTLLTFPALVGLGIPPLVANATSTVALWPGALASMWGYRRELVGARDWARRFAIPSVAGGLVGAWLLLRTPPARFDAIVPWLIFGATALFMIQGPVMRRVQRRAIPHRPTGILLGFQFAVAIYGGYFGAGAGILMLAALGFMGLTNIHRMNGLKNWGGFCMNVVAAGMFAASRLVHWPVALTMAVFALIGGYLGSRLAQRVGQAWVRRGIVAVGLLSGLWLLAR
ncbi:MAG TPA: sulfite exporter TauE/SafE family protein [Gemmatimonadaceae bacterium]